jgi:chaperonin GroES
VCAIERLQEIRSGRAGRGHRRADVRLVPRQLRHVVGLAQREARAVVLEPVGVGDRIQKGGKVLKPRNDYVAVRRDKPDTVSGGGIALVNLAEDVSLAPQQGVVLAIGPKVTQVKKGDRVLIGSYSGWAFKVDDEPVTLIKEKEIDGVVE